jgi:FG-GAP-like repeat/Secretion system C-terminal sorting domain/FG-GAP repeat
VNTAERKAIATPIKKFLTGEHVTAVMTDSVMTASGSIHLFEGFSLNYSAAPTRGSEYYAAAGSYSTGVSPYAIASGDFNADGYADIAVVNASDNTVSVFMNDTHGGLAAQAVYVLGGSPQALVIADMNEDGAPDIVAVNAASNTLSILLNKNLGDGSFTAAALSVPTGVSPQALAVGDLNNDGHLDVVIANSKDNSVSLFMNDGAAHVTLAKSIPVGTTPRAIAILDVNNDGLPDIAVMNRGSNSVTLLLNVHGTYVPSTYTTGATPAAMAANDFNRDGFIDLVTANAGSKDVSILFSNGTGGFTAASTVPMYNVPTALFSGDMNGDAVPDIVVAQYSISSDVNTVQVLANTGNGGFVRGDSVVVSSPVALTGFDLLNRGILHLAVPNLLTAKITLINPAGGQTPVLMAPLPSAPSLKQPISLQWQNAGRTVAYHIQIADSATGSFAVNDSTCVPRQYTVSALAYSAAYKWRVRALNDFGWGEFSPWRNFSTCVAPPHVPMLIAPVQSAIEQDAAPLFIWHRAATAGTYRLQVGEDSLLTRIVIDSVANDTLWQSGSLKIHAPYFWRVKAANFGGESDWSIIRSFVTLLPLPEKVRICAPLNDARLGAATIKFSWRIPQWEVKKYWFEIAADTLFMFRIVDSSAVDTTWQMQKFSGNQKYFWKVRALNAKGWGPFSDVSTFSIGATSVEDGAPLPDHFALEQNYPNPFNPSTQIQFSVAAASPVQLKIFDILGRQIADLLDERLSPGIYTVRWNARELPSGVYIYRLTAGSFVSTVAAKIMRIL